MGYIPASRIMELIAAAGGGASSWASITGKPSSFAPSSHAHSITDVSGLQNALDGKQPAGAYLTSVSWGQVTGKPAFFSGSYTDLTNKPALFSGAYADLTGKPALFDGTWASLTGKPTTFAPTAHNHAIADVTGLQTALDGKQATGTYATTALATTSANGLMSSADKTKLDGLSSGGGSDPWTVRKLAADYTNATVTFANVTDGTTALTFTPPANSDWELEGRILIQTTTATNLPRVGVNVAAGAAAGYGSANLWQAGATASTAVQANIGWSNPAAVQNAQIPAGGVLAANVPYLCEIIAAGRSGTTPSAITIQMAAETAGANICFVKRGSFIRTRLV